MLAVWLGLGNKKTLLVTFSKQSTGLVLEQDLHVVIVHMSDPSCM